MRILLISTNVSTSPYAVYPLGLSIISNALRKDNHTVEEYDFLKNNESFKYLEQRVLDFKPGLIGLSIRNIDNVNIINEKNYLNVVREIVKYIKQVYNGNIILGGSGFSLFPQSILKFCKADYGIVGEGEYNIKKFVHKLEKGYPPKEKIIYPNKESRSYIFSAQYNKELLNFYLKQGNMCPIQTKRGCPNKCVYCTYPYLEGTKIRPRQINHVIDDIKIATEECGAKMIYFTDSVFNDSKRYFIDLLKEMKRKKISVPWTGFFQPSHIQEDDVKLMKETGLNAVEIGADAATDTTLKKLGKNFSFNDICKTYKLFEKYDISCALYYIMGGPGETKETVDEGISNIKSIKNAISFIFMGIRILPNTPLEKIAREEGIINKNQDLMDSIYYFSPQIDKNWLTNKLYDSFKKEKNCIFPPDSYDNILKLIHQLGYSGLSLDKLIKSNRIKN